MGIARVVALTATPAVLLHLLALSVFQTPLSLFPMLASATAAFSSPPAVYLPVPFVTPPAKLAPTPSDCLSCLSLRILVFSKCLLHGVFATSTEVAAFTAHCLASAGPETCRVFQDPTAVSRLRCCPIAWL